MMLYLKFGKTMKARILKNFYALIAGISLFLTCAEAETAKTQIIWSGSMMAICAVSVKRFEHYMTDEDKNERV